MCQAETFNGSSVLSDLEVRVDAFLAIDYQKLSGVTKRTILLMFIITIYMYNLTIECTLFIKIIFIDCLLVCVLNASKLFVKGERIHK